MEFSLYNNTGSKVYANVNGIDYIIEPEKTSVAKCAAGIPVNIKLSRKAKSFAILNLFDLDNIMDWFESVSFLVLNTTYSLNITSDNNQCFRICNEVFNCDKYYQYDRLYLDDPIIKNDCTYEITRQKKIKKRVKLFNAYTTFVAIALLFFILALSFDMEHIKAGTFFSQSEFREEFLFGMGLGLIGFFGKVRVLRRYKKVTDEDYIQGCFKGNIEECKK